MRFFVYLTLIAALLVSFVPAQAMLAATVVEPANPNGWVVVDDNGKGGGLGNFASGPGTTPLGSGSAHLVLNNNTAGWIFTSAMQNGTKLADLTKLEYSTYVTTNDSVQTIALQLNVDYNVTDDVNTWQGRLVYEPYHTQNDAVNKGVWQTWNPILPETKWFATGGEGKTACPQSAPCTWSKILTDFPNIGFHTTMGAVSFKAGSGWNTFDGNLDAFTIGVGGTDQTFDFEPSSVEAASTVYVDDNFFAVHPVTQLPLPLPLYADPDGAGPAKSMGYDASVTVQGGVNLVAAGGTVKVAAGTYTEQVSVRDLDGITIEGAGQDEVTIVSPATLAVSVAPDRKAVVLVENSDDVTIMELTVDGAGTGNTNNRLFGVFYYNASGLMDNLTTKAMRHTPLNGVQGGVGFYVYNTDGIARTITTTDCTALDYQKGGFVFNGAGLTANVEGNTATGMGPTNLIAMNGIQVGYGANATLIGNTVTGHTYTGTGWTSGGILLYQASADVTSNVIVSNQVGISSDVSDFTALQNYISGGDYGIAQNGGASTITANNITSNEYGIDVYTFESATPYTADSIIRNNRFFNNNVGVANEIFVYPDQEAPVLDALNNWWSCNEGPNTEDCDGTYVDGGPVNVDTWLVLSLISDEPHPIFDRPATLTAFITKNNLGEVVSDPIDFPDGKDVVFDTNSSTVLLDSYSEDLVDGSAVSILTVAKEETLGTTTVSATLDNETVTLDLFTGLMKILLPLVTLGN